jgi:plasmid stabilization system protein ParE
LTNLSRASSRACASTTPSGPSAPRYDLHGHLQRARRSGSLRHLRLHRRARGRRFVESIEAYCLGFAHMPERGTKRDDLRLGLRTVGFRRRATILFEIDRTARRVVIHGVYYAGRSVEKVTEETD